MSFIRVQAPPARGSAKAGVSFSLVARKDGSVVALLTLTAPWQERFLGGPVAGRRFEVLHGRGDDEGLLSIVALNADASEGIEACNGPRGSVRLTLKAWDLLGTAPQPAQPCRVVDHDPDAVTLRLPDWCSQKERKSRDAASVIPPMKPVPRRTEG